MLRRLLLVAGLALAAGHAAAQTYQYEPAQVIITGVVTRETGESPDGARVQFPAVRLLRPITVQGDDEWPTEKGVVLMHAILSKPELAATHRRLIGKRAEITGRLIRSDSGHHQTNVLIDVDRIEPAR